MSFKVRVSLLTIMILTLTVLVSVIYIKVPDGKVPLGIFEKEEIDVLRDSYVHPDSNGMFNKGQYITRAELAQMIFEIENLEFNFDNVFDDTEENPYVGIISAVADKKYMVGNDSAMFLPDEKITRGTFATVIKNILTNNETLNFKDIRDYNDEFTDIEDLWNKHDIIKMYTLGFVDDNISKTYRPDDFLMKEEAIIILNRVYGYDEGDLDHMLELYRENPYEDIKETYWAFNDILRATIGLEK